MPSFNRRYFLKTSSVGLLPAVVPLTSVFASDANQVKWSPPNAPIIKLYGDGEMFNPSDYLNELHKANAAVEIEQDWYGVGGAIEQLEKKFSKIIILNTHVWIYLLSLKNTAKRVLFLH